MKCWEVGCIDKREILKWFDSDWLSKQIKECGVCREETCIAGENHSTSNATRILFAQSLISIVSNERNN